MFIKIAQLFLSLTILVSLHEFGHFWFAKKFKCRVDKFYLFFDFLFPFAGIMNFALFKKKIGDTEYGIGWFPFGGYVQIAGMVDEQMDKNIIETEPEPWELRSKPAWQRLLVMMGGILVNFLLGIFIFWMVLWYYGKDSLPISQIKQGLMVDSVAYNMGLRNGDFIVSLDGLPVKSINRIPVEIVMNRVQTIEGVHANGERFSLPVNDIDRAKILKSLKRSKFVEPRFVAKVALVDSTSYAATAKLQVDDRIIEVNGKSVYYFDELRNELRKNAGGEVSLVLLRGTDTVNTKSKVSEAGIIGFAPGMVDEIELINTKYGFFGAFVQGVKDGMEMISLQVKQFYVIFTVKEAHKQVGGFYTMVQQMSSSWDWHSFWTFTAFLSLALAFMNFLPIPMLDGGYIMFILWEMITGKKVSDKIIYYANQVGLFIVLALMIYANTDWLRD
ncbi:MAG: RIP metalloprotease RseP [Bacteroidia bacterium]